MALPITSSDELDMAMAAINGVTIPATASGMAIILYMIANAKFCFTKRCEKVAVRHALSTG